MLLNFTFGNFRSFRDEKTLSMETSSIKELEKSVIHKGFFNLLPVTILFGANSSGKSNALYALATMRDVLLDNVKLNPKDELYFLPFALDVNSPHKPTSFEIQILCNNVKYRYGFEYDKKHICAEWLYETTSDNQENNLFLRSGNEYEISETLFSEGLGKESSTPSNRLFVSLVAQLNGTKSQQILEWFEDCNCPSRKNHHNYADETWEMFNKHHDGYRQALNFFQHIHLGFNTLLVNKQAFPDKIWSELTDTTDENKLRAAQQLQGLKFVDVKSAHDIYNESGFVDHVDYFALDEMESEGTKKLIKLSGAIFETLKKGNVLVIDDLDAKLHTILTNNIIQLFMNPKSNSKGAQLIFTAHDTNLLNSDYLRKDQIWFTEKNEIASSDLYSLIEFQEEKSSKHKNKIQEDYTNGRFGAIPLLD